MNQSTQFTAVITNVSPDTTPKELYEALARFGKIDSVKIHSKRIHGISVSQGCGIAQCSSKEDLEAVVAQSGLITLNEYVLRISSGKKNNNNNNITIIGIPAGTTKNEILQIFAQWNPIKVKIIRSNSHTKLGHASLKFKSEEAQNNLLQAFPDHKFQLHGSESELVPTRDL